MATASVELAKVQEQRGRAAARVDALEREQRGAAAAAAAASAALAEHERQGGAPAGKRRELEQALAAAKSKAAEPWPERIAGARSAVRDCDRAVRSFVAENLSELIADLEADGQAAAERVNSAAADLLAAYSEREAVAARIGGLASMVGSLRPGDVTYSRAEAVAREATRFVQVGGEAAPQLRHDPREPRHAPLEAAGAA
jgi:chromosome segregation ATPase